MTIELGSTAVPAPGGTGAGGKDRGEASPPGGATSEPLPGGPRFRPPITRAGHYSPAWSDTPRSDLIRLDRNESTSPVSNRIAEALIAHITKQGVHTYPELGALGTALAGYCGVPRDCILATNGSDQGIDLALRVFLAEGDTMLVARPEFPMFGQIADVLGVRILGVPYGQAFEFPYQAFWEAIGDRRPDLITFINPNNPTGTPVDLDFIERVVRAFPAIPVIVDEAYYEFTGQSVLRLVESSPNLVVLRSFSKAFAMAGLRLGYLVASPSSIEQIGKARGPFDVNSLAIVAALAQLDAMDEVREHVRRIMHETKPAVVDYLRRHGVRMVEGAANFVLIEPENRAEAIEFLRASGILVRPMLSKRLDGMFRMSVGTPEEMRRFMRAYSAYLRGSAGQESKE